MVGAVAIVLGYGLKGTLRLDGPPEGMVLVLTGIGVFLWSLRHRGQGPSHPHSHTDNRHDHKHIHPQHHVIGKPSRAAWLVPAGIAASPDLTIPPIFLAAISVSVGAAIEVFIVYGRATIGSMVLLILVVLWAGYQVQWDWLERHANQVTAAPYW